MATVKAFIRTGKKDDLVNIRFRLSDGRAVQLFHASDILVMSSFWDAKREEYKQKVIIPAHYKSRETLYKEITDRKHLLLKIYSENKPKTSEDLNGLIDKVLNPDNNEDSKISTLLMRFARYTEQNYKDGILSEGSEKHYDVLRRELHRFLVIHNMLDVSVVNFTNEHILLFKDFLINEYTYVEQYRGLYTGLNDRNTPSETRSQNTVAVKLKKLQAFFTELEGIDEITVSPFRKLGKPRKRAILKETYNEPVCLRKDEYLSILKTDVPDALQATRDAFLLQCSFGCRISDFKALGYQNISVEDGIPYIHYLPQKTKNEGNTRKEIRTPILKRSLDIIKKYDFNFPILKYVSGERGYNAKIKQLLEFCKIDRMVAEYNDSIGRNEYLPLCQSASSKTARKTHVDMLNKVQIDKYASGLHKKGSKAVKHYTSESIKDKFTLMCAAFNDMEYITDNYLNILTEKQHL